MTTIAMKWPMSEVFRNPSVLTKAHKELDVIVGHHRKLVQESDLPHLKFLGCILWRKPSASTLHHPCSCHMLRLTLAKLVAMTYLQRRNRWWMYSRSLGTLRLGTILSYASLRGLWKRLGSTPKSASTSKTVNCYPLGQGGGFCLGMHMPKVCSIGHSQSIAQIWLVSTQSEESRGPGYVGAVNVPYSPEKCAIIGNVSKHLEQLW